MWSNLNSAKDGDILRGSDAQPSSPASDLARRVLTGDAVGPSCGARVTKAAALVSSFPTATSTGANFRGKDGMSQEWRGREMQQPFCGVIPRLISGAVEVIVARDRRGDVVTVLGAELDGEDVARDDRGVEGLGCVEFSPVLVGGGALRSRYD